MSDYLNYREAAAVLRVPLGTMYALVSQKRIPHVRLSRRLVRFDRSELESWINAHAVPPAPAGTPEAQRSNT